MGESVNMHCVGKFLAHQQLLCLFLCIQMYQLSHILYYMGNNYIYVTNWEINGE